VRRAILAGGVTLVNVAAAATADCCPSRILTRNYRFRSGAGRWVLCHQTWRHT
jgi:hypothetical protein